MMCLFFILRHRISSHMNIVAFKRNNAIKEDLAVFSRRFGDALGDLAIMKFNIALVC